MSEHSVLFPAERSGKNGVRERRVWARYATNIDGVCQPVAAETAAEPEMGWPGEIVELSCGGMTLTLERRFHPGTPLVIEVPSGNEQPSRFLEVRVIHAKRQPDDRWMHGCALRVKLSEADLQRLL
jgi:PilZ domain